MEVYGVFEDLVQRSQSVVNGSKPSVSDPSGMHVNALDRCVASVVFGKEVGQQEAVEGGKSDRPPDMTARPTRQRLTNRILRAFELSVENHDDQENNRDEQRQDNEHDVQDTGHGAAFNFGR